MSPSAIKIVATFSPTCILEDFGSKKPHSYRYLVNNTSEIHWHSKIHDKWDVLILRQVFFCWRFLDVIFNQLFHLSGLVPPCFAITTASISALSPNFNLVIRRRDFFNYTFTSLVLASQNQDRIVNRESITIIVPIQLPICIFGEAYRQHGACHQGIDHKSNHPEIVSWQWFCMYLSTSGAQEWCSKQKLSHINCERNVQGVFRHL